MRWGVSMGRFGIVDVGEIICVFLVLRFRYVGVGIWVRVYIYSFFYVKEI